MNAAMKVIELREPPLQKDNPNPNLAQWLNYIRHSQNAINSILSLKSRSETLPKTRYHTSGLVYILDVCCSYRHCWQRLRATQLFIEHVMLKHPTIDLKLPARRLTGVIKFRKLP